MRLALLAGEFLDNLSDVVKQIRRDNRAFGGIQLILCIGDFLQLPPIPRNKNDVVEMLSHGKDLHELHCNKGFAFQSKVWDEANMTTVVLDEVFRQRWVFVCSQLCSIIAILLYIQLCTQPLCMPFYMRIKQQQ